MKEKLKVYLEDNDLEIEELDFKDKDIQEIKTDLVELSNYFLIAFGNFYKLFRYCSDSKVKEFVENNKKHFNIIIDLLTRYKNLSVHVGKQDLQNDLFKYVNANYFDIIEVLDVYMEISE